MITIHKVKTLIVLIVFLAIIVISCTNKSSPLGSPGTKTEYHQITLPDTIITRIYTYRDTIATYAKTSDFLWRTFSERSINPKIIIGNFDNTKIRSLIRFTSLPIDTTFVSASITLHINYIHNTQDYQISIAPLQDVIFYDDYASWTQWGITSDRVWKNPGGDFNKEKLKIHNISLSDSIKTIELSIDREIVLEWISKGWEKNFGLIIFAENVNESFIEFNSANSASLKPQINLYYKKDNELENITRNALFSTFIHNKENDTIDDISSGLYISNIAPRSIFMDLFNLENIYQLFPGIENQNDLSLVNIIQASLILSVKNDNTRLTNDKIYMNTAIPNESQNEPQEIFDYSEMWHYARFRVGIDNDKININILGPIQQMISKNRPNNGICLVNNQRNMDFSSIEFYGKDASDHLRPVINIKYAVFKQ